jgi:hypothetical protein
MTHTVVPAYAGTHAWNTALFLVDWVPAFAGTTANALTVGVPA